MLTTILATIVVLGVLIFVHELGHFVTAKLVDIEVPRFSIGLGPKMIGFRRGETEYVISWLPLGGYVKMAGMQEMEQIEGGREPSDGEPDAGDGETAGPPSDIGLLSEEPTPAGPRDFESKSLPARAMVLSAGVIMNLLFAVAVFGASAWFWGVPFVPDTRIAEVEAEALPPGAEELAGVPERARLVAIGDRRVDDWNELERALISVPAGQVAFRFEDAPAVMVDVPADDEQRAALYTALRPAIDPLIRGVEDGSPAAEAGIRPGDRIVAVDGTPIENWAELVEEIRERPGQPVELTIQRDGTEIRTRLVPAAQEVATEDGGTETIGRAGVALVSDIGPGAAIGHGFAETWEWTTVIIGFLADLITGDMSPRNLGGPILVGQVSGEVARAGLEPLLRWMGIFSVNLAILNLLPIPMLDGGHLMFLGVEAVRGRALSFENRMRLSQVGFVIVLAIMVWAIANDVLRLFGI